MAWWNEKGSWRGEDWEKGEKGHGKKGKGQKGSKGKDGKSKDGKGKGWQKDWYPEARGQLSSEAADFIPSGLYDYDILSHQYWDMPGEDTWREFADHEGTKYYYNCKTGLTQWERPAELDVPSSPSPTAKDAKDGKDGKGAKGAKGAKGKGKGDAKGEGKGRKSEGKGRDKGKNRSKEKEDATFGPQGCNLFVFHLPDEWGDEDMVEQLGHKFWVIFHVYFCSKKEHIENK